MNKKEDLKHFGILGMRWGIRKDRKKSSDTRSEDKKRYDEFSKKKIGELSDKDLREYVGRIVLENQVKQFNKKPPTMLNKFLSTTGKKVGAAAFSTVATIAFKKIIDQYDKQKTPNAQKMSLFFSELEKQVKKG